ncbi:MAG: protoporphyrinogen oxidase HemJ [Alphaproteobacteria bacterium]|nr:protoporphyrinogen oxidase HemJ [Alphaproteobacteria bacterium]
MIDFISNAYLWLKAVHIIAVIAWMAGLLYLPRLFVYHAKTQVKSEVSTYFLIMEKKLLRFIMLPSMLLTFLSGGFLVLVSGVTQGSQGWMHAKLVLVLFLSFMHGLMVRWHKEFVADKRCHSEVFFRVVNEVPTVLMILIVILVIVKPF